MCFSLYRSGSSSPLRDECSSCFSRIVARMMYNKLLVLTNIFFLIGCIPSSGPTERALFAVEPETVNALCSSSTNSLHSFINISDVCTFAGLVRATQIQVEPQRVCELVKAECLSRNKDAALELSPCPRDILERARRCSETDTLMARCLKQKVRAVAEKSHLLSCEFAGDRKQTSLLVDTFIGFPETADCNFIRDECPSLFPFNVSHTPLHVH
jgi:hypothetical protein